MCPLRKLNAFMPFTAPFLSQNKIYRWLGLYFDKTVWQKEKLRIKLHQLIEIKRRKIEIWETRNTFCIFPLIKYLVFLYAFIRLNNAIIIIFCQVIVWCLACESAKSINAMFLLKKRLVQSLQKRIEQTLHT